MRGVTRAATIVAMLAAVVMGAKTAASAEAVNCTAPMPLVAIQAPLTESAARVRLGDTLTIVAVGSSSTEGIGASSPAHAYPALLEHELHERFPDLALRVINRGKGGEDAGEEMARLERDVVADHPDLVIWQVGTNAVLRQDDLALDGEIIERGVARLKQIGADVVLMDLQDAPRVTARSTFGVMQGLIAGVAKRDNIGLFRRFDIMRNRATEHPAEAARMIGSDGLHMTDDGYGCLAVNLAEALAWNWWSQTPPSARTARIAAFHPKSGDAGPIRPSAP
ncbi:MAG: SGNH/GDSL hydrolase family protein [Alphaproteobacteria bacterium]|nr:SGNH/GDSL hydrolase family protein [Alphaproteobacteria bacterium]